MKFVRLLAIGLLVILFIIVCGRAIPAAFSPALTNPTSEENTLPGTTTWRLTDPAIQKEIEGYASLTSVNVGKEIRLFVNTRDASYTIEIFRMGWYGGAGARQVMDAVTRSGTRQPPPQISTETGLIECDWKDPYVLKVPETGWISGVYLAKLTGSSGKQSYILFVVRQDNRASDFLFQSSVTTFQAYNNWGGKSLYRFNSRGRQAFKVSFNRPYAPSPNPSAAYGVGAGEFLTNVQPPRRTSNSGWEYNMVRWLEREGYDVTYSTDIDTHADPNQLLKHRVFLVVGHDEYWTWQMRRHVETARDAGVSLGIFSANTCYWQIRLEPSRLDWTPDRTIVSYKEFTPIDPFLRDRQSVNDNLVTTRWRDRPINRPEAELLGVMYDVDPVNSDITLSAAAPDWMLMNTGLKAGDKLVGLLGYEVDRIAASSPPGTVTVARSPYPHRGRTRYSDATVYTASSGATVFATGTIQWSWGLDDFNAPELRLPRSTPAVQQLTRNLLAKLLETSRPQGFGRSPALRNQGGNIRGLS